MTPPLDTAAIRERLKDWLERTTECTAKELTLLSIDMPTLLDEVERLQTLIQQHCDGLC